MGERGSGSETYRNPTAAVRRIATRVGTKIVRQPHADTIRPETTGPKAGPRVIIMPPTQRYVPSFARGATARTVLIIVGMNTPVPTDWMSRNMSSIQNVMLTIGWNPR